MRRKVIVVVGLVVLGGSGVFFGLPVWRSYVIRRQDGRLLAAAEQALKTGRTHEAAALAQTRKHRLAATDSAWADLEVAAALQTRDMIRLAGLYLEQPKALRRNEDASLFLLFFFYEAGRTNQAASIRQAWRGREQRAGAWLAADADRLARDGKRDEAIALLKKTVFGTREDCPRLMRLAMLSMATPKVAFGYLDEAAKADPENAEARLFKAQVFETLGDRRQARVEYMAACNWQPQNPFLFHRLAQFYIRGGAVLPAADAWTQALKAGADGEIWLQAWAWSHLAGGIEDATWASFVPPTGAERPAIDMLRALKTGTLWNETAYRRIESQGRPLQHQTFYWLSLLQAIHDGQHDRALSIMDQDGIQPRQDSWAPALERHLRILITRRLSADGTQAGTREDVATGSHPFLAILQQSFDKTQPLSAQQTDLLASRDAFAAACLVEGWMAAALFLTDTTVAAEARPDWLVYGLAQSAAGLRGPKAGLDLLSDAHLTPLLSCLAGSFNLAAGNREAAQRILTPLVAEKDNFGVRAATLLALDALDTNQNDQAVRWVEANPRLAEMDEGKEILARAAIARNDEATATAILKPLAARSILAKTFLAMQAGKAGRLEEAEKLLTELAQAQPDEPRYARELHRLRESMQSAQGAQP